MNLQSLDELDDSFGISVAKIAFAGKPRSYRICAGRKSATNPTSVGASGAAIRLAREEARQPSEDAANALANRLPRAPAARSITA